MTSVGARWASRWDTLRANEAGLTILEGRLHPALIRELRIFARLTPEVAQDVIVALLNAGRRDLRVINEAAEEQL